MPNYCSGQELGILTSKTSKVRDLASFLENEEVGPGNVDGWRALEAT